MQRLLEKLLAPGITVYQLGNVEQVVGYIATSPTRCTDLLEGFARFLKYNDLLTFPGRNIGCRKTASSTCTQDGDTVRHV